MQKETMTSSAPVAPVVEPKRRGKGRKFFSLIFLLTLAGLIYSQYQLYLLKNPTYQQQLAQEQVQAIIDKVSKLMILPSEAPQVLVLQDVEKVKAQQPFFKDAENGDQVLVYPTIAIIYSPSKNKIVNVGPVIRDAQTGNSQVQNTPVTNTATGTKTTAPAKTGTSTKAQER